MIEIRKAYTSRMTWAQLKAGVKDSTVPLNIGDEIDITLKTGENVTLVCERIRDGRATFYGQDYSKKRQVFVPNSNMVCINLLYRCSKDEHSWPLQTDF